MSNHFVHFVVSSGDIVSTHFTCTALEDAYCRSRVEKDLFGNVESKEVGLECCYLLDVANDPNYCYDGKEMNILELASKVVCGKLPIKFTWEGEYYTWEFE